MLEFDDAATKLLDTAYQGADFTRRRRANFDALAPLPGQVLLDLGCGNGLLTQDLARAVGPTGQVHGVDPAEPMLAAARDRCAGQDNVTLHAGSADAIPLPDASLDGAVSVQVFEYVADLAAALGEVHRVLRPGARLVIGDIHFGTFTWASDDPERMRRMQAAWEDHLAHLALPEVLAPALVQAGFRTEAVIPVASVDTVLRPDGLAAMMMVLMHGFAVQRGLVPRDEADAWRAEQHARAAAGRFFHTLTHFVTVARRA